MKVNTLKITGVALLAMAFSSSCSVATDSKEVALEKQTLTYEYIMEGSNEMSVTFDVNEMLGESISVDEIHEATLGSIVIKKNDSLGLSEINQAKVQLMGESEDLNMVTVAVSDSIIATSKEVSLTILDEVEVAKYLKEDNLTLVLDLSYIKDQEMEQNYDVFVKFNLEVKAKEK